MRRLVTLLENCPETDHCSSGHNPVSGLYESALPLFLFIGVGMFRILGGGGGGGGPRFRILGGGGQGGGQFTAGT